MAEINCVGEVKNDTNLKLYYRYEETSGTSVADSSGNSNTGTASRTNILNNSGGQFGNRSVFVAASSDKITINDHATLKPTGNWSVGSWYKGATVNGLIFQSYSQNTAVAGIQIKIDGAGKVACVSGKNTGTGGSDFVTVTGTTVVTDDAWHLCVATYDGTNIRIYVDSSTAETTTAWSNNAAYAATNYVRVGCDNASGTDGTFLNGSLDETFLLNGTVLTGAQILRLYSGACDVTGVVAHSAFFL